MPGRLHVLVVSEDAAVRERLAAELPAAVGDATTEVRVSTADSPGAVHAVLERSRIDCLVVSTEATDSEGRPLVSKLRVDGVPLVSFERSVPDEHDLDNLGHVVYDAARNTVGSLDHRALFEAVNVGLAVRNLETLELVDINQQYLDILGIDRASVIDTNPTHVTADVPGYDAERAFDEVETAREEGGSVFTWPIENAAGDTVWIRVSLTVAEISGRDRLISTVEDVTAECRRERDLEAFQGAVDAVDAGVTITEDDRHVYVNEAAADICGYPNTEAMLGTGWGNLHDEAELERLRETIPPALEADGKWQGEVSIRRLDDELVPVRFSITSLEGDRNVIVFQSLSEQKLREDELERSRDFLERTQRISKVGGWELDLVTATLAWTDQTKRIHAVSLDYEPTVDDAVEFYAAEERDRVRELLDRCRSEGVPWEDEFRLVTAEGAEVWVRTRGEPVIRDGRVSSLRGTIQDVTARRTREDELERMNAELEALNRIVRHDIRNDMAVVVGWAELLREHVDEEGADILSRILSTGRHTTEITEVARDLMETMSGGGVETRPMSLANAVERELAVRREAFPRATFEVDGEIPDVAVRANPLIASVLGNLLNNAVQHNADDTVVTVSATVDDDAQTARIRIADDGSGIPDARKSVVFGKGEKGLESTGTGLGLYLVNQLVDSFGGEVHFEDNDPMGAVAVVSIPLAAVA
ncbi:MULTISPECIES: PAS domain-containing sensor histidine kinase [Haloferax]|uniref:histidine kinase n=1 Tax=Haloferax massiliensis TaxID=1476858 RepID=A0A0D6JM64_9EURY|nr:MULTISPECIES: PAS domain-containing sensor histidine kinase [Haloferax]MDS0243337.1 PAS domain-containing sensor histidine kinase [Haloferax sp. S2CR25]MDS0446458.1 PAS domain-containing sensor histidine kinase [Haloferax sp. S2CR25-2]CQR48982.1 Sensor protein CreC [Haloferax massiliensis]